MKNLVIASTKKTPEIIFKATGDLMITGSSLPVNIKDFYQPILVWLEDLKATSPKKITLSFDLDHINTSSTRMFLQILKLINSINEGKLKLTVNWYYDNDDDDMLEQGKSFQEVINHKIEFIEKEND